MCPAGSASESFGLMMLQSTACNLLKVHIHLVHSVMFVDQDPTSRAASTTAAATSLMVVSVWHISELVQQQQQQQDKDPPLILTHLYPLATYVAQCTLLCSIHAVDLYRQLGPQALLDRGPHFVVWSDMALLLMTYVSIFEQQRQLPVFEGQAGSSSESGRDAAAGIAAAAPAGTAAASSVSIISSSRGRQRRRRRSQQAPLETDEFRTWREAQDQFERVPASHKLLLQQLAISPVTAVLLATMSARHIELCCPPMAAWEWNPHNVLASAGSAGGVPASRVVPPALVQQLEQQLRHQDSTLSRELLQLLLLYGAAHAAEADDDFIFSCHKLLGPMALMLRAGADSRCIPASSPAAQHELLLLILKLLQRLQRLRGGVASSPTSTPRAAAAAATRYTHLSVAERTSCTSRSEAAGIDVLLVLAQNILAGRPVLSIRCSGLSPAAAAAAAPLTEPHSGASSSGGPRAGSSSAQLGTTAALQGAAAGPAGGNGAGSNGVFVAALSQNVGAVLGHCESFLRGQVTSPSLEMWTIEHVARNCCCSARNGQPYPLLRLAQEGTGEQKVGFFLLLVTALKLSGTAPLSTNAEACSRCTFSVASAALTMLQHAFYGGVGAAPPAAPAGCGVNVGFAANSSSSEQGGSGIGTSAALWLLLLGRCCLRWAAELAQMQAQGADWQQLIRLAQQQVLQNSHGQGTLLMRMCFAHRQLPISCLASSAANVLKSPTGMTAGLTAAGYDVGVVLQAFEALAAFPTRDVLTAVQQGPGYVAAGHVLRLIEALEAVGKACSVFAVPHCCNNPGCDNLTGASELVLVSGKGCICGGCKVARYCGKGCQKAHWKQHKPVCKMLRAAAPVHHS